MKAVFSLNWFYLRTIDILNSSIVFQPVNRLEAEDQILIENGKKLRILQQIHSASNQRN
jgi:hypothetical protein